MTAEVTSLTDRIAVRPELPKDSYAAELEARVIQLASGAIMERAGSSVLAMVWAQALVTYLGHRSRTVYTAEQVNKLAGVHLRRIENYLRSLPDDALARLRHPACGRNRSRQQAIFERLSSMDRRTAQEAVDG